MSLPPLTRRATLALAAALGIGRPAGAAPTGAPTDAPTGAPTGDTPRGRAWQDFHVIMWQTQSAARYEAMRPLGVDAAMVFGFRTLPITEAALARNLAAPRAAGMRIYVENVATDFYAAYHRWTPEHPKAPNYRFVELQRQLEADPDDDSAFIRQPSLSDPAWLTRIARRMRANGRAFAPYRPLYYSLGDETGIADLAAAWDFDRAPVSLAAFRVWLRGQYDTLAQLNRQWGAAFADWQAVTPPTTSAALAQDDGNESAWLDFRRFMDHAFAHALRIGTDALHAGDPHGLAGIEGTQAPGPGGYDYSRLAHAVDVMEMYGAGDSIDIARSFNPDLVVLTTGFGGGDAERRRIWHSVLLGARALILWDGERDFVDDAGRPSKRARALAPLLRELRGGVAAQWIAMRPQPSPVAILYSPESQHLQWLLARRADGTPWYRRTSETEWKDDNPTRRAIAAAVRTLTHLGFTPRFVSAAMLEAGLLTADDAPRALVLPQAAVLSAGAVAAIRDFHQAGGVVVADGVPGGYDGRGRRRKAPPFKDVKTPLVALDAMADALAQAGIISGFALRTADHAPAAGVAMRVRQSGDVVLLALERDPAGDADAPARFDLVLPAESHIRLLGDPAGAAATDHFEVRLGKVAPVLLAISPAPLPGPTLSGPATAAAGATARWELGLTHPSRAAHALAIRLRDPSGGSAPAHQAVVVLRSGSAAWQAQFPADAPAGPWWIEVIDILSGKATGAAIELTRG